MRSGHYFYCQNGHIFQHDSVLDDSVSWDSHIPAHCKECDEKQNLMGPFIDTEQADYVLNRRWKQVS